MTRRPLLGACGVAALCAVASFVLIHGGSCAGTFAGFNAETHNSSSTFAGAWINAPTNVTATLSGNAAANLTWTKSTSTPTGIGQELLGSPTASNGTSTTCPTTGYVVLPTTVTASAQSATDPATDFKAGAGNGGDYYCYTVAATLATNWVSMWAPGASTASRVKFVFYASAASVSNGGTSGSINNGDGITITLNNTISGTTPSSISVIACSNSSTTNKNTLLLGSSSCSSTPSLGILALTGKTITGTNSTFASSSYSVSAADVISISLAGGSTTALSASGTATWKFTPTSTVTQAGGVAICTASGSGCVPTASGAF